MNTLSNEELIEIISGVVDGVQPTTQEMVMARELLALRKEREAAVPIYQCMEDGNWYDTEKRLYDEVNENGNMCRVLYTAPPAQPVAVPELKELEAVLDWILMLPVPTQKATQMAKRLAVVIDSCRDAMLAAAPGKEGGC